MRILNLSAGTTFGTAQIETPAQKLSFRLSAVNGTLAATDKYDGYTAFQKLAGSSVIKLVKQTPSGQVTIIDSTSLVDLAELACFNEGEINIRSIAPAGTGDYECFFTVEISNHGSLAISNENKFILDISGLPSTTSTEVYALDSMNLTDMHIVYKRLAFVANQTRDINVSDAYAVAVPKSNFTEMNSTFVNGRSIVYTATEIQSILNDIQPVKYNFEGIVDTGSWGKYYLVPVAEMNNAKITCSSASDVYLLFNDQLKG